MTRISSATRSTSRSGWSRIPTPGSARLTDLVDAWERADVAAITELLASEARMSMPPLPAWFEGREAIGGFMRERMFATPWRVVPMRANGQPALACYQQPAPGESYVLGGVTVLAFEGASITALVSFLRPMIDERFGLPMEFRENLAQDR